MTDHFTQATISPCLPASLFSDDEIDAMEAAFGLTCADVRRATDRSLLRAATDSDELVPYER